MLKRYLMSGLTAGLLSLTSVNATEVGVVSFRRCIEESHQGKAEQTSLENLKNQMTAVVEKTDKELEDLSKKLQDSEYLDGLSPDAEHKMRQRFDELSQEMARYQQQFYQIMNQANMKFMQTMSVQIATAAKAIAQERELDYIVNEDACFYFKPDREVTSEVVDEMNRTYTTTPALQEAKQ